MAAIIICLLGSVLDIFTSIDSFGLHITPNELDLNIVLILQTINLIPREVM